MSKPVLSAMTFVFVAVASLRLLADPKPEDAIITFYSHGSLMTSGLPGSKHGIYYGAIYDGMQQLFWFSDGFFVKNNRYAVFHLPAGPHVFSASYNKKPSKDRSLTLDLQAGEHYYVRTQSESSGVVVFEVERGRLDQMPCQTAHLELVDAKPLSSKAISHAATAEWLHADALSMTCP